MAYKRNCLRRVQFLDFFYDLQGLSWVRPNQEIAIIDVISDREGVINRLYLFKVAMKLGFYLPNFDSFVNRGGREVVKGALNSMVA